jgi:hypothetical protein
LISSNGKQSIHVTLNLSQLFGVTSGQGLELFLELALGYLGRSVKPDLIVFLDCLQLFGLTGCRRCQRLFMTGFEGILCASFLRFGVGRPPCAPL